MDGQTGGHPIVKERTEGQTVSRTERGTEGRTGGDRLMDWRTCETERWKGLVDGQTARQPVRQTA